MIKKVKVHGFEGEWRIVAELIRSGRTILILECDDKMMFAKTVNEDVERSAGPFTLGDISDIAFKVAFGQLPHGAVTPNLTALALGFFYAAAPRLDQNPTNIQQPTKH